MKTILLPALAAGTLLLTAPAHAIPPVGGAAQGYSEFLDESIVEVKRRNRRGHRHVRAVRIHRHVHHHHRHARHHRHVRHHHFKRHRHFAFRVHRRHHHRWYDPCPYGYVLEYGRCVPYYIR